MKASATLHEDWLASMLPLPGWPEAKSMTCIVIFEVNAKKGTGAQLLEAFRSISPVTRVHDGCEGLEVTTGALGNAKTL